jgi:hypothetical protein
MKTDFWNRLESRLLDIYQNHPGIRFLLTSSENSRKFNFTCFHKDEELERMQETHDPNLGLRRGHTDVKIFEM